MSKIRWTLPVSADFNTAADWSGGALPGAGDTAILGADGGTPYTVTASTDETVGALQTAANATLTIAGGTFTATHGTGKKGANAGTIDFSNFATFAIGGTFDNRGAIIENVGLLRLNADTKLKGGGQIALTSFLFSAAGGITLTNVDNTIVGAGSIGNAQGMSLVNEAAAVIDATGSLDLEMGGGTVTNAGRLEASGVGSLVILQTAVDGSGGGTITAHDGATVILAGADIIGGALTSSGTGFIQTAANQPASVLDGRASAVTNAGLLEVTDQTTLTLEGVIANRGDIFLDSGRNGTTLFIGADTALTGGGQVALGDSLINVITGATPATVLDNVDNTIIGGGQFGFGALTLKNEAAGVIDATGTSNGLVLACSGAVENAGLIEATGQAGLSIYHTIDQSAGGVILADGAAVNLAADIIGGTLRAKNGGSVQTIYKGQTTIIDGRASAVAIAGPFRITFGAKVTVEGAISNTGTIALSGVPGLGSSTLAIGADTTLTGGGQVTLIDNIGSPNVIIGATASTTLTNIDNTISGAGNIGDGALKLVNQAKGVIDANGNNVLTIDTGAFTLVNAGLIEATGAGGMNLDPGGLRNTGTIKVDGSLIEVNAAVTGSGSAVINDGELDFNQGFNENVTFTGASGGLGLGRSQTYGGAISGFSASGGTSLDLRDIGFTGSGEASFSGTKASGVLTVSDGTHSAHINLIGDYRHTGFVTSGDGLGGVIVAASGGAAAVPARHGFIAAMASLAAPPLGHAQFAHEDWRAPPRLFAGPRPQAA